MYLRSNIPGSGVVYSAPRMIGKLRVSSTGADGDRATAEDAGCNPDAEEESGRCQMSEARS
jgi:hypothetical protein